MTASDDWIAQRLQGAPSALRERVEHWLASVGDAEPADRCAAAGRAALEHALAGSRDRASASEVLAADALVTLALLARAEQEPAGLVGFARGLRRQAETATVVGSKWQPIPDPGS